MPPLTDLKREKFCQHLVKFGHRERAVVYAGFNCKTSEQKSASAAVQASLLLKDPKVMRRISELAEMSASRVALSKGRVLMEAAKIAFVDPRKFFNPDGELLPIHELDPDTAAALAGIEVDQITLGKGEKKTKLKTSKIKLAPKVAALTLLAQHYQLLGKGIDQGQGQGGDTHFHFYMPDNQRALTDLPVLINPPVIDSQPPQTNGGSNGHNGGDLALPSNGR